MSNDSTKTPAETWSDFKVAVRGAREVFTVADWAAVLAPLLARAVFWFAVVATIARVWWPR